MLIKAIKCIAALSLSVFISACGFHAQGKAVLAQPLQKIYIETPDPYGYLARYLKENLKMSGAVITTDASQATTILDIVQDDSTQTLLNVSGTQQTRQYNIGVLVTFKILNNKNVIVVDSQTLSTTRTITVQSNQILGSSNESTLFYRQMRHELAGAIINRIASKEITRIVNTAYAKKQ